MSRRILGIPAPEKMCANKRYICNNRKRVFYGEFNIPYRARFSQSAPIALELLSTGKKSKLFATAYEFDLEISRSNSTTMLRPRLRIPRAGRLWRPAIPIRSIHQVPTISHFDSRQGVPGLLSPGGFDIAWTQYMQFVIEKLNSLIAGTCKMPDTDRSSLQFC